MKPHIERKQRERENIRKAILQAALDIAVAEGWNNVTIRKIADAIEYTTSIVYTHFDGKEALLKEITDGGFRALYRKFTESLDEKLSPAEQLMAISLSHWDFAAENRVLYQLMFSMDRPSGEDADKGMNIIRDIFRRLTGKPDEETDSLILNWICLRQGSIDNLLTSNDDENYNINRVHALYSEFIKRFIGSIK